jgi:hypothetical protein
MAAGQWTTTANGQTAQMFRCLACDRLITDKQCPICGTDNGEWRDRKEFYYLGRFPFSLIWGSVGCVVFVTFLLGLLLSPVGALLATVSSIVIASTVYFLKFRLRDLELSRQVKGKGSGPGLVTLAMLCIGLALLLSIVIILLLQAAFFFTPVGEQTTTQGGVELAQYLSLVNSLLYGIFSPLLVLALMLVGVWFFSKRLDKDFPSPIYLDTDKLVRVTLKSAGIQLRMKAEDGLGPDILPLPPIGIEKLSELTDTVASLVRKMLNIADEKKSELVVLSVAGRREEGLSFVFGQRGGSAYRVDSDLNGQIKGVAGDPQLSPQVEEIRVASAIRTDSGGLNMVVSRQIKSEKWDEKTGEFIVISAEKRYEVEADEWGYICSLKEQAPAKK